jgi:6-phosphogluconolactonase
MTKPEISICRDVEDLSRKAAEQFVAAARQAIDARARFSVALSGGSTPKGLYSVLATPEFVGQIDWAQVHLFWGDERCVPPDHPESNFRMVKDALLSRIAIPSENVHRMMGEDEPNRAAADYQEELRRFFSPAGLPRFDLILLGLGEDGHTASLFPGSTALNETESWVTHAYVEKLNAHRLTLTLPVINNGAQVFFLVSGVSKAPIVKEILTNAASDYPAARIRPADGQLCWFVTHDAYQP